MESDLQQHRHHFLHDHQIQHHQKQLNSGLTRYQSAPSSYFSSFLDKDAFEDFLMRPSSPETERIFARFLSNSAGNTDDTENTSNSIIPEQKIIQSDQQQQQQQLMQLQQQQQQQQQQQSYYQTQPPQPQLQQQNFQSQNVGMDRFSTQPMKMSGAGAGPGGNNSNLIRHSSSPAGLFSNITIENGYVMMKGMGDYGGGNNTIKRESTSYASSGKPPTGAKPMSPIVEVDNKTSNAGFKEGHNGNYSTGFPMDSWDDSSMMPENIVSEVNRLREDDRTLSGLSATETQSIDLGTRPPPLLAHHLSLPKDIATIEKLLHYQDSVPCKIRAKRGCATHPRSIAERVRRTKISERMRKLQELVPNMDKQTNTADMLDLAVDYVKELQCQVKALSDNRAKCTCAKQEQQ